MYTVCITFAGCTHTVAYNLERCLRESWAGKWTLCPTRITTTMALNKLCKKSMQILCNVEAFKNEYLTAPAAAAAAAPATAAVCSLGASLCSQQECYNS